MQACMAGTLTARGRYRYGPYPADVPVLCSVLEQVNPSVHVDLLIRAKFSTALVSLVQPSVLGVLRPPSTVLPVLNLVAVQLYL